MSGMRIGEYFAGTERICGGGGFGEGFGWTAGWGELRKVRGCAGILFDVREVERVNRKHLKQNATFARMHLFVF